MMKKTILFLVLMFVGLNVSAESYTAQQKQLITQISSFLNSEGYPVEEQDDGLRFTHEGTKYYVKVTKEDISPMFIRMCRYVKYSDQMKQEDVAKKLNSYNSRYGIKVFCTETSLVISTEMFVGSSADFTGVFDTLLIQMKAAYKSITE